MCWNYCFSSTAVLLLFIIAISRFDVAISTYCMLLKASTTLKFKWKLGQLWKRPISHFHKHLQREKFMQIHIFWLLYNFLNVNKILYDSFWQIICLYLTVPVHLISRHNPAIYLYSCTLNYFIPLWFNE